MKSHKLFWFKFSCISTAFLGIYATAAFFIKEPLFGIHHNLSDSLPFSFFLSTKINAIQPYTYVMLEHPKSAVRLAKQVIGLPGDHVTIKHNIFYINDVEYGIIQARTRSGQPIHPIQEGKIPEGFVFVYASHPYSYDSRYAEFGLVAISDLQEKLWPLF